MTIHPVLLLEASGLLPPKPGGWEGTTAAYGTKEAEVMTKGSDEEWDWRKVEAENARGLKLAQNLAGLEVTHLEWSGNRWPALDIFRDLF